MLFNPVSQFQLFGGGIQDPGWSDDFYVIYAHGVFRKLQDGRMLL